MLISSRNLLHVLSCSFALVMLSACGTKEEAKTDANSESPPNNELIPKYEPAPVTAPEGSMDAAIARLMAKAELPDENITVQHVLIAFQGAKRATVTRTKEEAKKLTEKTWTEARSGVNFKDLIQMHSNDGGGGEYKMVKAGPPKLVMGFRNVGFRLKVGDIGVAPFHSVDSPFGWHIIKRVK
jgi:parvulin-like peptidyl-prolyl isomerase